MRCKFAIMFPSKRVEEDSSLIFSTVGSTVRSFFCWKASHCSHSQKAQEDVSVWGKWNIFHKADSWTFTAVCHWFERPPPRTLISHRWALGACPPNGFPGFAHLLPALIRQWVTYEFLSQKPDSGPACHQRAGTLYLKWEPRLCLDSVGYRHRSQFPLTQTADRKLSGAWSSLSFTALHETGTQRLLRTARTVIMKLVSFLILGLCGNLSKSHLMERIQLCEPHCGQVPSARRTPLLHHHSCHALSSRTSLLRKKLIITVCYSLLLLLLLISNFEHVYFRAL